MNTIQKKTVFKGRTRFRIFYLFRNTIPHKNGTIKELKNDPKMIRFRKKIPATLPNLILPKLLVTYNNITNINYKMVKYTIKMSISYMFYYKIYL